MQAIQQNHSSLRINHSDIPWAKGIMWGLLGGLVATLVMDLILMGILTAVGLPALACYSLVGDTVTRLFSQHDVSSMGSILSGVAAHYIVGPVMGALFGAAVVKVNARRSGNAFGVNSLKKAMIFAVLYAELLSQPILAIPPIILGMTKPELLTWYGGSFGIHFVWGCVLGMICFRGLRLPGRGFSPG